MELWATRIPETGTVVAQAERAEQHGWDGITFTDSQNLVGDPFVAVALAAAATERLRFATGVTNAFTRHPAALANVAATVQETSGGRFVLGIGRGDTALFHLGRKPQPVDDFIANRHRRADVSRQRHGRLRRLPEPHAVARPRPPTQGAARHRRFGSARHRLLGDDLPSTSRSRSAPTPTACAWALDLARKAAADAGPRPRRDLVRRLRQRRLPSRPRRGPRRSSAARSPRSPTSRRCPGRPAPGWPKATATSSPRSAAATTATSTSATTRPHTEPLTPEFVDRFAVVGPPAVRASTASSGSRSWVSTGSCSPGQASGPTGSTHGPPNS